MSFLSFLENLTFEFRFLGELFDVYELAHILAEKLDIPIFDEDMIKYVSEGLHIPESQVKKGNEAPRRNLIHAITSGGMYAATMEDICAYINAR